MKFVIRYDKNGYPYWVIVSSNGRDLCWSESYERKEGALHSIQLVKSGAWNAPVEE